MVQSSIHEPRTVILCLRSVRGKFKLTNQDSAGGKNFTVLTPMLVNRKSIEISLFISLEMELNIHEKEFTIPKTYRFLKKEKIKKCVSQHDSLLLGLFLPKVPKFYFGSQRRSLYFQ